MKNQNLKGSLLLLLASFIWGSAFVAQSDGMNYIGPFTFLSARFFLGAAVLLPIIIINKKRRKAESNTRQGSSLIAGAVCGVLLFIAAALQQYGIMFTSVSKAGFLTTLYVVFVPIFSIFMGKRLGANAIIGSALAVLGLYLLCITDGLALSLGDSLVFACGIVFAL